MVTAAEMAQIQADAAAATCDLTCTIQRKTPTLDAYGSETDTWNTIAVVPAGMAQPTAAQLQNYDYLIGALASWQIRLPFGTDVKAQDHLLINGQTLVVQVFLVPKSLQVFVNVLASEVKQ